MRHFSQQTFYELLGVAEGSPPEVIRDAYEQRATLPDPEVISLFGLSSRAELAGLHQRLKQAFDVLSDSGRREAYDRQLATGESTSPPTQLAMFDLLSPVQPPHSTAPTYAVSYIPHPPPSVAPTVSAGGDDAPPPPVMPQGEQILAPRPSPATVTRLRPMRTVETSVVKALPSHEQGSTRPALSPPGRPSLVALSSGSMRPANSTPRSGPQALPGVEAPKASPRRLDGASEMSQEAAIGIAEASMAQLTARVREGRVAAAAEERPKGFEVPSEAEFNGELLRKVRQAKGLTIAQVGERTRIGKNHLENIEADRYDALPATVYLRGILMSLARELGLDSIRVSKSYLALVTKSHK